MANKPRIEAPKPPVIPISEGLRQELAMNGRAVDPATGRVLVMSDDGTVRYETK